ncbi:hypothetical protein ID866_2092 [Astraeus odoratus]|nr:hypothetical protein ID866_2092 [Astraeus odoratus]
MASGIPVSDQCVMDFKKLQRERVHNCVIYQLSSNNSEIVVGHAGKVANYGEFLKYLPEGECRWAVYDLEFEKDGAKRNKICFFSWAPDNAKIKQKMVFASSRDALKRRLDGIHIEIQASDPTEVEYEVVLSKAQASTR